jgi:hypothetical protein
VVPHKKTGPFLALSSYATKTLLWAQVEFFISIYDSYRVAPVKANPAPVLLKDHGHRECDFPFSFHLSSFPHQRHARLYLVNINMLAHIYT